MNLATRYPSRVSKLIVVDIVPWPSSYPERIMSYLKAMQRLDLNQIRTRQQADEVLKEKIPVRPKILTTSGFPTF